MRQTARPLLLLSIAVALFMASAAHPAAAQCVVATGTLASGGSISVTAPPGHTYVFAYTGAAIGQITVVGTLNIVNGTGGVLNYIIYDLGCEPVPTLSGSMMALMGLLLAGVGWQFLRLRR